MQDALGGNFSRYGLGSARQSPSEFLMRLNLASWKVMDLPKPLPVVFSVNDMAERRF